MELLSSLKLPRKSVSKTGHCNGGEQLEFGNWLGLLDRNGLLGASSKKQLQNSWVVGCKLGSIQYTEAAVGKKTQEHRNTKNTVIKYKYKIHKYKTAGLSIVN